jgi:hypothetical protein
MAPSTDEPVVFLMPDGTEVSNDPRFFQKEMQKQLAEQQKHVRTATEAGPDANKPPVPDEVGKSTVMGNGEATPLTDPSAESVTDPVELPENFEELKGDELKALAKSLKSRGVEISTTGVRKTDELREAIRTGFNNYDPDHDPELEDDDDES